MGKTDIIAINKFEKKDVNNKDLVIEMLKYEEQITKSDYGQSMYKNMLNRPLISLTVEKSLNRLTLSKFGFDTSDENVEMYRTIFRTYFKSPSNYDKDVINSVHYMRENKCVFYKAPILEINDVSPNVILHDYISLTKQTLHDIMTESKANYTITAAFSLS